LASGEPCRVKDRIRREGTAPVVEDHALTLTVNDDGRDRAAVPAQALHACGVHPLTLEMARKHVGRCIVAHRPTKGHIGAQTGQGHSGIGRHATHALVMVMGWGFGWMGWKGMHAKHHVQSDMAHTHQSRFHRHILSKHLR